MTISVSMSGVKDVEKVFRNMPKSTQNKVMRQSLRAGAKIVRNAAKENVRALVSDEATGMLARSIAVYSARKKRGMLRFMVMIRRGAVNTKKLVNGAPVRIGLYAAVLEYGKQGQPPRSWIRKAVRDNVQAVLAVVLQESKQRMDDAVKDAKL